MNILIAEDEQDILELIELHLIMEGFDVFKAHNGIEAINVFEENQIDLVLLDVMMPLLDGFKVLRKIREKSSLPVIFITARGEDSDKVLGLGIGADDYVVKPFSPIELMARVQAQLRRYYKYNNNQNTLLIVGNLVLDKESCSLKKGNDEVPLNAKEFKMLQYMMANAGKIFTKKQLYEAIWEEAYFGDDNTIMVHISHLRDKIEENPKSPKYIKTIKGIGYKMEKLT